MDHLSHSLVEFRWNQLADLDIVIHGPCKRLVFDDGDLMLSRDLADLQSNEILSFGDDQRSAAFLAFIA